MILIIIKIVYIFDLAKFIKLNEIMILPMRTIISIGFAFLACFLQVISIIDLPSVLIFTFYDRFPGFLGQISVGSESVCLWLVSQIEGNFVSMSRSSCLMVPTTIVHNKPRNSIIIASHTSAFEQSKIRW